MQGLARNRFVTEEGIILALCREYHCTPLAVLEQPADLILAHLQIRAAEERDQAFRDARAKATAKPVRPRGRRRR